jgi:error-prone DNA polymerase
MGVEMRPIDAQHSEWQCTLEAEKPFAVRMGLRFVKRFGEKEGERLVEARRDGPFASIADVSRRAGLERRALDALAEAGAFESFDLSRREALWEAPGAVSDARLPLPLSRKSGDADQPSFPLLDAGEHVAWDYRSSSHSVRGHPVAALRPMLAEQGIPDARTVRARGSGKLVHYAGLVILRQRPATASEVTFMTLEDETGFVNVVIWDRVFQAFSVLARTAYWLGVTGIVESKHGVVHLIAERLWVPRGFPVPEHLGSRDFH